MPNPPSDVLSTGHLLCRVCNKGCPMIAEIRDGPLAAVRGDRDNELFEGYTCVKGRALPAFVNGPGRLLRSLRRSPDGFEPIAVAAAMDEIAARLSEIRHRYGPRSIATSYGTQLQNVPAGPLMRAFSAAIGSEMRFAASSLDKPGRSIACAMLGKRQAPPYPLRGQQRRATAQHPRLLRPLLRAAPHEQCAGTHPGRAAALTARAIRLTIQLSDR